jgi:carbon-monoxide dehydrogenase medium subunit
MIPGEFSYAAPRTLDEALALLAATADAKVLGGGMSLLPALKHRLTQPSALIDLARIPGLDQVVLRDGKVVIGGCATHASILASEAAGALPILREAASVLGDVQVRNRGTFGGSLVHADPAADWPAVFLALDGEADVVGAKGKRTVPAAQFFTSMLTSAVRRDEVLTEVRLKAGPERTGSAYLKLRQPASGFAIVGVAARVTLDAVARITEVAVGVTGVNAVPFRAKSLEQRLVGQVPDVFTFRTACGAMSEADPMDDLSASAEYRQHLLAVFATRALALACERAQR